MPRTTPQPTAGGARQVAARTRRTRLRGTQHLAAAPASGAARRLRYFRIGRARDRASAISGRGRSSAASTLIAMRSTAPGGDSV